ncbi:MAG: hypothetical protein N2316_02750 [Spirochaetes bacterium]|nr:hypothetical protein [Spirochaetota bacterium]
MVLQIGQKMRRYIGFLVQFFVFSVALFPRLVFAQNYIRSTLVIDTPTAYTIARGTYQISVLGYDGGGVELKTFIGLHDNIFLGVSFDVQHAIGKEETQPNVPGVVARIKLTDGWERFPISFAIGYDSFYIGNHSQLYSKEAESVEIKNTTLNRMLYGPYFVVTKPIYLFDDEQHISFGMRVPTQPYYIPDDASYFISLDVPMGHYFMIKMESERIYYNFREPSEWLFNMAFRYSYMNFGIELGFLFQHDEPVHRIIRLEYRDEF